MKFVTRLKKKFKKLFKKSRKTRREEYDYEDERPSRESWTPRLISIAFTFVILGLLGLAYFSYGLPDTSQLGEALKTPSITVLDEDGTILGAYGDIYGDTLVYQQFPKHLIQAVLATEDRNFFKHYGVDPFGVVRALFINMKEGRVTQGGSTITQQLAKNLFLTPDRTFKRKIQEMLIAFWLEARYSKQEIMSLYLNRVYLGAGNFGMDAAAQRYFSKSVKDISLGEAAVLTGLLKAPSRYAPTSNPKLAKERAKQVLVNMVDAGYLTEEQKNVAVKELAKKVSNADRGVQGSLYFADWIVEQLPEYIGDIREDITVKTTLNHKLQLMAEEAVEKTLASKGQGANAQQAALVAMTPQGAIKAMVGGRNYAKSQFNRVTQAKRQPGSSFKLFVYLAGLEAGYSPNTTMDDRPVSVGNWQPRNYTGRYEGLMSLRYAFAHSINSVAVQLSENVGRTRVIKMAERLGITSQLSNSPSIALGTSEVTLLEMATAYAHVANGGQILYPHGISEIRNTKGDVLFEYGDTLSGDALSTSTVEQMNDMLMSVVESGTGMAANIGRPVAGKTGTTQDYRDAWFIGFTPQMVAGVWSGNDGSQSMNKVTGGNLPAQIWRGFMQPALKGEPVQAIPRDRGDAGFVLPWQQEQRQPINPQPFESPQPQPQQRPSGGNGQPSGDVLTPSFWQKLFQEGDVQYDYPDQRRR